MEQPSDIDRFYWFVDRLPFNKVLDYQKWDERYIDDVNTYQNYELAKSIAIQRNRYRNMLDTAKDGYSLDPYKATCDYNDGKNCHPCCDYNQDKNKCVYDGKKCNDFYASNVTNWPGLCSYHILFLQGKTPGTPDHIGPWAAETSYIVNPLIRILSKGILTLDSQPGLMLVDKNGYEYLQKPYLSIGGPVGRIHRILAKILNPPENIKTLDNTIIKYVPYGELRIDFSKYKNYVKDDQDYVRIFLGIDNFPDLNIEYIDYLLSNRLFDRIANIVETTI